MANNKLPQYHELMNPVLDALHQLGGSGSIDEIAEVVIENSDFSDEIVNQMHNPDESNQTEIEYRLAWARTYLKKYGIINNSSRGVWALVPDKNDIKKVNPDQVVEKIREGFKKKKESKKLKMMLSMRIYQMKKAHGIKSYIMYLPKKCPLMPLNV